ncbi:hypothetical protein JHK85_018989 [Glycine max]|nr:hypothetical protein JHK85_018989 [Glycine max]
MIVAVDLNASPVPEDDEDDFGRQVEEYRTPEERVESAVDIAHQECEERKRKLKREHSDDKPVQVSQSPGHDQLFHTKILKSYDRSKLPPGWLDCPSFGQEIYCMIPSKVPLGESFNDDIIPGKRYSFKQVIHQQRVLGRKLDLVIDLTNTSRYYSVADLKKEGIKYVKAIKIFSDARPPGIYKPEYIDALYAFYHEKKPEMIVCPPTPEWKRTPELVDLNGEAMPDDDDDGVPGSPLHENHVTDTIMRNDDVLGDEIPNDQQDAFRQFCFRTLKLGVGGMAEKTHHFTLLDGEMIIDTLPDSKKQERRYLIYDLMAINGVSVIERPFYERWKMLEKVIEPRNQERFQSRNPYYRYDMEPFRVRRKDFWLLSTVTKLLSEFIPKLSHDADGLIFQGWDDPYIPRTHEGLLKWKYAELNSVDFLFEIDNDCQLLLLYERGKRKLLEGYRVAFEGLDPLHYSGKIIECSWDSDRQEWIFKRIRTDKSTPNDFNTYRKPSPRLASQSITKNHHPH